jgi:hypothetical protein
MIIIEEANIQNLIFHKIKLDEKDATTSNASIDIEYEDDENTLKKIFLKPFLNAFSTYEFQHEINIELNPLYKFCESIIEKNNYVADTKDIATHLFSVSKHPNIKDGDLFIVKYDHVIFKDKAYEALGIYKIENKENFIETDANDISINFRKGIGTKRLDKACLVLFTDKPYTVLVIDNAKIETDYWQNEFLKIKLKNDHINSTNQFLTLTKEFVTEQFPTEFETTKKDQIDILKRSVDFFKTHDTFDKEEFEQEVLQQENIIQSFSKFDERYKQENRIEIEDGFEISSQALKKQEKVFKSVIKLDKNFHIYIHGDRDLIEHGIENDGRKFYKIYYSDES